MNLAGLPPIARAIRAQVLSFDAAPSLESTQLDPRTATYSDDALVLIGQDGLPRPVGRMYVNARKAVGKPVGDDDPDDLAIRTAPVTAPGIA